MTEEQERRLIAAMAAANTPITQRLDAVNAHLRELNGKVASHAALHEGSRVRFELFGTRLDNLERRGENPGRRETDQEGENRGLRKWDAVLLFGGISIGITALLGLLKIVGKL